MRKRTFSETNAYSILTWTVLLILIIALANHADFSLSPISQAWPGTGNGASWSGNETNWTGDDIKLLDCWPCQLLWVQSTLANLVYHLPLLCRDFLAHIVTTETTRISAAISNTPHTTPATMAAVRPMFDPDGPVRNRESKFIKSSLSWQTEWWHTLWTASYIIPCTILGFTMTTKCTEMYW